LITPNPSDILGLNPIGPMRFRSSALHGNFGGAIYGGQLLGQAMRAAAATVPPELLCHSQHAHFIGRGDPAIPVDYDVTPLRDGRSALRRVAASQEGRLVIEATCSFAHDAEGMTHAPAMPSAPPPHACIDLTSYVTQQSDRLPPDIVERYAREYPLERRPVDPDAMFLDGTEPAQMVWLRLRDAASYAAPADQRCITAYMSDAWLSAAAFRPHFTIAGSASFRGMSLDHAVWIHATAPSEGWFLYVTDGPWAGSRRGFGRGQLFDEGGVLIASAAQEGLSLRTRPTAKDDK
jgi:acyl-CoA thioesterase-2